MTREELEHTIRASADITNQYEFVIVGSQSMLGAVPRPEPEFTVSLVSRMPIDDRVQRTLRATIRRWAKAVRP